MILASIMDSAARNTPAKGIGMTKKPVSWVANGIYLEVRYDDGSEDMFYVTEHGTLAIWAMIKNYMEITPEDTIRECLDMICST